MKKNMGRADRIIRSLIALLIFGLYFGGVISGLVATILAVLAVVFILTSTIGTCPIYWIFGLSTCKTNN